MATKVENEKGFLVIEMTGVEAVIKCDFGMQNQMYYWLLCDNCNATITDETVYYVAVLNRILCKKCYDRWIKNAKRYAEDVPYEIKHFNHYAEILGLI